jgi:hypothetical protein
MLYIALIAGVAPVTVQYWGELTNINRLTGFIQVILSLSARRNLSFPMVHVTAQYAKAWACTGASNLIHDNEQQFELELEAVLEPEIGA